MTFNHLKTTSATFALYRFIIRKVIFFDFQSLMQHPLSDTTQLWYYSVRRKNNTSNDLTSQSALISFSAVELASVWIGEQTTIWSENKSVVESVNIGVVFE